MSNRSCSSMKLNWFFVDTFVRFAKDKPNKRGVRVQKHQEVICYNGEPYTITFERGDLLN